MTKAFSSKLALPVLAVLVLGGGALGASLYFSHHAQAEPAKQAAPQTVQVGVYTVVPEEVRLWSDFSGRLRAVDYAEVRPEVSGRITQVMFEDGQVVKKGDVLFVIDPRPYEAAVAKAEANLATAKTNANYAKTELDRAEELVRSKTIATRIYDERANANRVAAAAIKAAEADLDKARLDLEYAHVKAPITGRVSRAEITVGNVVQAGPTAPVLTSVVSNEGIYADFEVDERTYMENIRNNARSKHEENQVQVEMTVLGDQKRVYRGTIQSFDNRIDTASGTIRARAKFANEDGSLIPGMFVSVKLASSGDKKSIVVPEQALNTDQSKRFVYLVTAESKVAYREVEAGKQVDGKRIILSGLIEGDRVIVEGGQMVRPDMPVEVKSTAYDPRRLQGSGEATPEVIPGAAPNAAGEPAKQ